jgi:hypothetical protein
MNPTSLTFALGVAALVALTGWFIDWGAGKPGGWSTRNRPIARVISVLATIAVRIFVYRSDAQLRGTPPSSSAVKWQGRRPSSRMRRAPFPSIAQGGTTSK